MKTKLTLLLALLLLIGWSCRKDLGIETDAQVPADFWSYHPKTIKGEKASGVEKRETLTRGMADLKKMKETKHFEKYVTKFGIPGWDQSIEFTDKAGAKVLLVPIRDDKKKSVPVLIVMTYAGNHYQYHVVQKGKYPKATGKNQGRDLPPEKIWNGFFTAFDQEVYHTGNGKGGFTKKLVKVKNSGTSISDDWVEIVAWECTWGCYDYNDDDECDPGTYWWNCHFDYYYIWWDGPGQFQGSEGEGTGTQCCSGTDNGDSGGGAYADAALIYITNHLTISGAQYL